MYPTKDSWISSGSNHITGESEKEKNFGGDEILELKKVFWNKAFDYPTRVLLQFDKTEIDNAVTDATTLSGSAVTNQRYFLRLYEASGNSDMSSAYTLTANPVTQSWDEGIGKFGQEPNLKRKVSWINRTSSDNVYTLDTAWDTPGGALNLTQSYESSQSFSYESPDIEMDITSMVNGWRNSTFSNYGLLLKYSGSQETDDVTFGKLNFFSKNTHTIYSPRLEMRWDDHVACTGDNTGSLLQIDVTGSADNIIYAKNLQPKYRTTDKVKFRIGTRERYVNKTFSRSIYTISGSYIPEGSGSYSIVDVATGENVVPFSDSYTKLSCDSTSNYFIQWMNGLYPNRKYKILYKLKYDNGQQQIFDSNFEFDVVE